MPENPASEAMARRDWPDAYAHLEAAAGAPDPRPSDLERLGVVAGLRGMDDEGARAWERAHTAYAAANDPASAARCAFLLALSFMNRGEMARAGGWLARAQRVLEETGADCPETGYVRIPAGLQLLDEGDTRAARTVFAEIMTIARRFDDVDLATLGSLGFGHASVREGDVRGGMARLDEAMVSVMANEVSPLFAGIVYCAVIEVCHEAFDLARAHEWTAALTRWCEEQKGLVAFRGRCQVYRAELMRIQGDWSAALAEALQAEQRLSGPPPHPAVAEAFYIQGELHRLRGAHEDANAAYQLAEESGRRPEPGRALLRLAQGRVAPAVNAIRHALDEAAGAAQRAPLLVAAVEILAAADEVEASRHAADELAGMAAALDSTWLRAAAARAVGTASLAAGHPAEAVPRLRDALAGWNTLDAPYETARTRALLARAAALMGDEETSAVQREAALRTLAALGAAPDPALTGVGAPGSAGKSHGLTPREVEVLRLVARGLTNRAIAASLTISEKTAANHVGNILGKLGVSSRAAATAYAYEQDLL